MSSTALESWRSGKAGLRGAFSLTIWGRPKPLARARSTGLGRRADRRAPLSRAGGEQEKCSPTGGAGAVVAWLARSISAESSNRKKAMLTDVGMSVEARDRSRVRVKLQKPLGLVPYLLGLGEAVVMAPGVIPEAKSQAVGTGPFKFVRW